MTDEDAAQAISTLQHWAREKFGERDFKYYRVSHTWLQSRTRSGRPRNDGSYYTNLTNRPEVSQEEYEAKREGGRAEELKAFMGKRKGGRFDTYEAKQVKDGWQDYLQRLIVAVE